jgi:hypothetical protein
VILALGGEHFDALDASLQQAYAPRDPIAQYIRGKITGRQLRVLANHLPPDSPLTRALNGNAWQEETWLLHDISTALRMLHANVANALGAKPRAVVKPLPTPLDGQTAKVSIEQEKRLAKTKSEMDKTALRIFANPN